jgi:hypothetical protein
MNENQISHVRCSNPKMAKCCVEVSSLRPGNPRMISVWQNRSLLRAKPAREGRTRDIQLRRMRPKELYVVACQGLSMTIRSFLMSAHHAVFVTWSGILPGPTTNGHEDGGDLLFSHAVSHRPGCRADGLSGRGSVSLLKQDVVDYLVKPVRKDQLLEVIKKSAAFSPWNRICKRRSSES